LSEKGKLSAMLAGIVQSDEFWSNILAMHSSQFVQEIYRYLLGRKADPKGLAVYSELINTTGSLAGALDALMCSREFRVLYARRKGLPDPAPWFERPCLVFLHIQKTAGTSIQNHLSDCFTKEELYREHANSLHTRAPGELAKFNIFAGHLITMHCGISPGRPYSYSPS
jgi:hypothetical protein